jgi:hypothetical protein
MFAHSKSEIEHIAIPKPAQSKDGLSVFQALCNALGGAEEYGLETPILFSKIHMILGFKVTLWVLDEHNLTEEYASALLLFACDCGDRTPGAATYLPVFTYLKALRGFAAGSVTGSDYEAARAIIDDTGLWSGATFADEGTVNESCWGFNNWKSFWALEWERAYTSFICDQDGSSDHARFDSEVYSQGAMLMRTLQGLEKAKKVS